MLFDILLALAGLFVGAVLAVCFSRKRQKKATDAILISNNAFLSAAAHQLRTPLNQIVGVLQVLDLQREGLSEKHKELLGVLNEGTSSLSGALIDILDILDLQASTLRIDIEKVNFRSVVKSLERRFKSRAVKKNLALTVDVRKMAHWHFKMDEVRFVQCVSSLLNQCIHQTNKGAVKLSFDFSGSGKGNKGALIVTIRDDSDGMDQYVTDAYFRPEVYEINSQMTNSEGRRLSLMLARMLVQKMGGELSVKSAVGSGVTFQITLPVEMAPAPANEIEQGELSPVERARTLLADKTILAVDDNLPNLMIVKALLSQGKVGTILTAENGLEAVKIIAQGKCDLVLMDVQMPVLDGLTATREIRRCGKSFANVPIIALTAAVRAEDTQNYKDGGMNAVLAKPVILDDMFETIERVLLEEKKSKAA